MAGLREVNSGKRAWNKKSLLRGRLLLTNQINRRQSQDIRETSNDHKAGRMTCQNMKKTSHDWQDVSQLKLWWPRWEKKDTTVTSATTHRHKDTSSVLGLNLPELKWRKKKTIAKINDQDGKNFPSNWTQHKLIHLLSNQHSEWKPAQATPGQTPRKFLSVTKDRYGLCSSITHDSTKQTLCRQSISRSRNPLGLKAIIHCTFHPSAYFGTHSFTWLRCLVVQNENSRVFLSVCHAVDRWTTLISGLWVSESPQNAKAHEFFNYCCKSVLTSKVDTCNQMYWSVPYSSSVCYVTGFLSVCYTIPLKL